MQWKTIDLRLVLSLAQPWAALDGVGHADAVAVGQRQEAVVVQHRVEVLDPDGAGRFAAPKKCRLDTKLLCDHLSINL